MKKSVKPQTQKQDAQAAGFGKKGLLYNKT